jgi:hypothetical protein
VVLDNTAGTIIAALAEARLLILEIAGNQSGESLLRGRSVAECALLIDAGIFRRYQRTCLLERMRIKFAFAALSGSINSLTVKLSDSILSLKHSISILSLSAWHVSPVSFRLSLSGAYAPL